MNTTFLTLLLFLLAFSHLLSASAVPATRTQTLNAQHTLPLSSLRQVIFPVDAVEFSRNVGEVEEEVEEERLIERRMDLEIQDYGGTGANKDHDPKSPGRT